jgi:hypothetical protein
MNATVHPAYSLKILSGLRPELKRIELPMAGEGVSLSGGVRPVPFRDW